ncbi:MAG TPA: uL15 family ribosomal protein [Candidatus Nanoarchaeia archaeon]|nr:uL15 family ribosomal protein [Candidatus Nanoarchaeia archaeon]
MKTTKRKKSSRMHGRKQGTHGWGARKKHKKSGHRGGKGLSGTGKRADHKKTLMTKLYGNKYFGKQGETSKRTQRDKSDRISLRTIESNIKGFLDRGIAKQSSKGIEINLAGYKILGNDKIKNKLLITAENASKSATESVKKAGGEILFGKKLNKSPNSDK